MRLKKILRLQWAKHQRRWFGKWHVYLGLIAGLIIAVVGLTGSILTFQDEIDVALNKTLFEVRKDQHKISLEAVIPLPVSRSKPLSEMEAGRTNRCLLN